MTDLNLNLLSEPNGFTLQPVAVMPMLLLIQTLAAQRGTMLVAMLFEHRCVHVRSQRGENEMVVGGVYASSVVTLSVVVSADNAVEKVQDIVYYLAKIPLCGVAWQLTLSRPVVKKEAAQRSEVGKRSE
ncbi:hypothetical protein Tco_0699609 [Tanacetum coccineum]